jgi:glycosyltransferase involved in cell wall biosynthesis
MVSVCMASYNGEKYIKQQINSILCQLSGNDELIISDDGSSDNTLRIINDIHDDRIRLLHHERKTVSTSMPYNKFQYVTANFENALKHTLGDYIYLSDQDDIWMADKVKKINLKLQNYEFIVHNYKKINASGKCICEQAFKDIPIHKNFLMNILDNHFRGCCIAFRRGSLDFLLPFPSGLIGHDYFIGVLCCHFCQYKYLIEPLIEYRYTNESVSSIKKHSLLYSLFIRLQLFFLTTQRIIKYRLSLKN